MHSEIKKLVRVVGIQERMYQDFAPTLGASNGSPEQAPIYLVQFGAVKPGQGPFVHIEVPFNTREEALEFKLGAEYELTFRAA